MVLTLDRLPDEILLSILCYSPPSSSAALTQTARRFRNVTNEPTLWRFYSQAYFNFWDAKHEMSKKLASPVLLVNWRTLYIRRHLIDGMVSKLVDSILQTQTGRIEKFRAIIDLGYDAKDTLLRHISVNPEKKDFLARRFALDTIYPSLMCFILTFVGCDL